MDKEPDTVLGTRNRTGTAATVRLGLGQLAPLGGVLVEFARP